MLDHIKTENIIFLDIETVPQYPDFKLIPEKEQALWEKKSQFFRKQEQAASEVYNRAGIYAEFGKIICVSAGFVHKEDGQKLIRIKSYFGDDEKIILSEVSALFRAFGEKREFSLCAHNGKEFDFPYLCRRLLIQGMVVPEILDTGGKKPWEVKHVDTMELWKFGDFKHFTSLELLAHIFGIPSPKEDLDGSMISDVYYREKDLTRIVKYCEKDVITIIQILLKFKGESTVPGDRISVIR
jgi:predicted PolB exonuclease-like 3'-5' exonuclease